MAQFDLHQFNMAREALDRITWDAADITWNDNAPNFTAEWNENGTFTTREEGEQEMIFCSAILMDKELMSKEEFDSFWTSSGPEWEQNGNRRRLWTARSVLNIRRGSEEFFRESDLGTFYDGFRWHNNFGVYNNNQIGSDSLADKLLEVFSITVPSLYSLRFLGNYQSSTYFGLSSGISDIPVFRLELAAEEVSTETIKIPVKIPNGNHSYFPPFLLQDENIKVPLFDLLNKLREIKKYDTIRVVCPRGAGSIVGLSNDPKELLLVLGSAPTKDAYNNGGSILLPAHNGDWKLIKNYIHSNMSREKIFLGSYPFAEISNNTIWLFPKTLEYDKANSIALLSFCLNVLIQHGKGELASITSKYLEAKRGASISIWEQALAAIAPRALANAKGEVTQLEAYIKDYTKSLEEHWRSLTAQQSVIASLDFGEEAWRKKGREEFNKIENLACIKSVEFDGEQMEVFTDYLHILHPETEEFHALGEIRFSFQPQQGAGTIRIKNLTHTFVGYWNECAHPHVEQNSAGCQGTLSNSLAKLFGQGAYSEAIEQIIFFLQTVNIHDGAGERIDEWPLSNGKYPDGTYREGVLIS